MSAKRILEKWLQPAALATLVACGGEAEHVRYHADIKPLFEARCVACHFSEQDYTDLENPFNTEPSVAGGNHGAVRGGSLWFDRMDYGPPFNVAPYEPEKSYLLEKVRNPELRPAACTAERCLPRDGGFFMPPASRQLRGEQISFVRDWILAGADPAVFRDRIKPASSLEPGGYSVLNLFGNYSNLPEAPGDPCAFTGSDPGCTQCASCHREDGPYFPQGVTAEDLINVNATFRTDLKLVVPFKPEESFLMMKLEAQVPSSDLGSPMPHGYEALSTDQVALLRQWIAEGAKNN